MIHLQDCITLQEPTAYSKLKLSAVYRKHVLKLTVYAELCFILAVNESMQSIKHLAFQ